MYKKKYLYLVIAISILVTVSIFVSKDTVHERLNRSLDNYIEASNYFVNRKDTKEVIEKINKSYTLNTHSNGKYIARVLQYYFKDKNFEYLYDRNISTPAELIANKKGDCKDYALFISTVLRKSGVGHYIIVRDKYEDNKEERVGHVYLALPSNKNENGSIMLQNGEYILPFETIPYDKKRDDYEDTFKRAEASFTDKNGKQPKRLSVFIEGYREE